MIISQPPCTIAAGWLAKLQYIVVTWTRVVWLMIYTQGPQAQRAEGVYIRQTMSAHVNCYNCYVPLSYRSQTHVCNK